jgi:hypothetical protein
MGALEHLDRHPPDDGLVEAEIAAFATDFGNANTSARALVHPSQ